MSLGSRFLEKLCLFMSLSLFCVPSVLGQDVKIEVALDQALAHFERYAWAENAIITRQSPDEAKQTEEWIVAAVNRELEKKGYAQDEKNCDFLIKIRALGMVGDSLTSANMDHRMPAGGFIYESNRPLGMGVRIWLEVIGGIRIIVTDKDSGETVWEAQLTKKYKDPEKLKKNLQKEINKVIEKGLKKFPSSKKRP